MGGEAPQKPMPLALNFAFAAATDLAEALKFEDLSFGLDGQDLLLSVASYMPIRIQCEWGIEKEVIVASFKRDTCEIFYMEQQWFIGAEELPAQFVYGLHPLAQFAAAVADVAQVKLDSFIQLKGQFSGRSNALDDCA